MRYFYFLMCVNRTQDPFPWTNSIAAPNFQVWLTANSEMYLKDVTRTNPNCLFWNMEETWI